jgi:hypothetical protein
VYKLFGIWTHFIPSLQVKQLAAQVVSPATARFNVNLTSAKIRSARFARGPNGEIKPTSNF